jgi:large subunit ribosomal protein L28
MARYSCTAQLTGSAEQLSEAIRALLERCQLTILHYSPDYWVAGEPPGKSPYTKLVTVEVLVDRTGQGPDGPVQITCIAKNEELPLRSVKHCQQTFAPIEGRASPVASPTLLPSGKALYNSGAELLAPMARRCQLTNKKRNNAFAISHSHRRTKRLQEVNLQWKRIWWEEGKRFVRLRVSTKALKTLKTKGLGAMAREAGIDLNQF